MSMPRRTQSENKGQSFQWSESTFVNTSLHCPHFPQLTVGWWECPHGWRPSQVFQVPRPCSCFTPHRTASNSPLSSTIRADNHGSASSDPQKPSAEEAEKVLFPTSSMKKSKPREVEKFKDAQLKKKKKMAGPSYKPSGLDSRCHALSFCTSSHLPDELAGPQADSHVWT